MKNSKKPLAMACLTLLLMCASQSWADQQKEEQSWGSRFVAKASHGFANIGTGIVELPKNITNITDDSNIFAGMTLGVVRGVLHAVTRTLVGAAEFLTSPIPTDDYVTPGYVWERFSEDTRYFGLHYPLYWTTFGTLDEGEKLRLR